MEVLKQLRKEQKKTQAQMSKILGISQQAYATYEIGTRIPPADMLQKIADYFDVSVDYLLGRTEIPKPESLTEGLVMPPALEGVPFAFSGGLEGLSQKSLDDLAQYIEFLKEKEKQKK